MEQHTQSLLDNAEQRLSELREERDQVQSYLDQLKRAFSRTDFSLPEADEQISKRPSASEAETEESGDASAEAHAFALSSGGAQQEPQNDEATEAAESDTSTEAVVPAQSAGNGGRQSPNQKPGAPRQR